jgi:acetyl esterase/lipase
MKMRVSKSVIVILVSVVIFVFITVQIAFGREGRRPRRPDAYYEEFQTRIGRYIYKKTAQGELTINIHFPKDWKVADKRPAIVFFFGGGWNAGTVEQFTNQAHYLASRGMVAARADYRVRSRHQTTPDKCVEDAKSAVRWLRKNAAKFGINPDKIVASGGSAGGHMAACTSTTIGLDAKAEDTKISAKPNLLVLYNPVLDCTSERIVQRLGSAEMAKRISPNLNLSKDIPVAIVFYGTKDKFLAQGKEFRQLSEKLGNTIELYTAEGQPHGFFNRSPWHQQTTFLVDKFLTKHGYLHGEPTIKLIEGEITLKNIAATSDIDVKNQGQRPKK